MPATTTTRLSGMVNLTYAVNNDTQLTVNYFSTTGTNKTAIAPVPYAALTMNPGTQFFPGNGVTPAPKNFAIDPTLPIAVQWRTVAAGARADESDNKQQRFLVGLDGSLAGWDYSTAVSYNSNDVTNKLTGGYSDGGLITAGVQNGVINPFGAQTAAGTAAINAALLKGTLLTGKGEVTSFDAHASRELGDWTGSGRATALAIGTEFRRETSSFKANSDFAAKVIASTGVDPATDSHGTRDVYAFNAELNVPITKQLEVTGAARYDHYSDFGSTFNPKLSFRFQPSSSLLFRGSASTGFRAPSLYDINAPQTYTNTANSWDDPVQCPDGTPVPGALPTACGQQFMSLSGGNKALKPEKSKNFTLGTVIEPVKDLSVGVDFWWIKLTDQIGSLSDVTIFSNTTKYAYLFKRAPNGSLSIDGSQCPGAQCGYVLDTTMNLGGVHTNGADLSLAYRIRTASAGTFDIRYSGTYVAKYEYQNEPNGEWVQNVGVYSGAGPIFRLQHNVNLNWSKGDYSVGLTNHYKSDYIDENAGGQTNTVKSYSTWDIDGSWNITKGLTLVLGVKNLFDTNPPFSNQGNTFQTGYDPRFTDPLGRAYYLRGTYRF